MCAQIEKRLNHTLVMPQSHFRNENSILNMLVVSFTKQHVYVVIGSEIDLFYFCIHVFPELSVRRYSCIRLFFSLFKAVP